jgi:Tol biopolymer transport system component
MPRVELPEQLPVKLLSRHAPNTTPWGPSWSPDGKWIAVAMYVSGRVEPKTRVWAEELSDDYNAKLHSSPNWSPDGRWHLYTADDSESSLMTGRSTPPRYFRRNGKRVAY